MYNVFDNMSLIGSRFQRYAGFCSESKKSPLMVALVHTGINIGVVSVTPLRVSSHTLAFPRCLITLNWSLDIRYDQIIVSDCTKMSCRHKDTLALCYNLYASRRSQKCIVCWLQTSRYSQFFCVSV